jgi:hypothetical protein
MSAPLKTSNFMHHAMPAMGHAWPCLAFSTSDTHISFFIMLSAYMTLWLYFIPQSGPGMARGTPKNPWGWLEMAKRIAATAAEIIVNDLIGEISLNAKQHTIDLES